MSGWLVSFPIERASSAFLFLSAIWCALFSLSNFCHFGCIELVSQRCDFEEDGAREKDRKSLEVAKEQEE